MDKSLVCKLKKENKKNIAIYGITKQSREVFDRLSTFFNVYFMDQEETEKVKNLRFLVSLQQAEEKKIDSFILCRQLIFRQDIFDSLMVYCRKFGADIYDLHGIKLNEICQEAKDCAYSNKEQILNEIDKHTCISFDIFDTLLARKVLIPEDVFELTGKRAEAEGIYIKDFKEKRMKAQRKLGLSDPDIYDIYDNFHQMYQISKKKLDICLNIELQIEMDVLIPRKDMLDIYQICLNIGKNVFLVTDMYIPKRKLIDILEWNGISGYDAIYVSCDKKQLKLEGLFECYKKDYPGETYLHIGDHRIHDGVCAKLAGIDYCLIARGFDMARQALFKSVMQKERSLEERIMLGMIIARIMNSPFSEGWQSGRVLIASDYAYGYCFCAVLLCIFVFWICEKAKENYYDDILFASRDGYLIQHMYEMILNRKKQQEMPRGKYFYTSRKAAVMTGINNEASINMLIDISQGMEPEKIMAERFGLPSGQILDYQKEVYGDSIHQYVWTHADKIFKRAEEAKRNYFKYMGNIGLEIGKKYAFIDFVSSGTCQKSLQRIAPFEMEGIYMGWNGKEEKTETGVMALYEGSDSYFMGHYKIMETFLSSKEPSLSCFDRTGNPMFMEQDRSPQEMEYVEHMQKACMDFLSEFLQIIREWDHGVSHQFADNIFAAGSKIMMSDKNSILNHLELMDDWKQEKSKVELLMMDT